MPYRYHIENALLSQTRHRGLLRRALLSSFLILSITALSSTALASPWTLPSDELALSIDQTFQQADREFLDDGTLQKFPINGYFRAQTMRLGARYGFTDRMEGAIDLDIAQLTYSADPLILDEFDDPPSSGEATDTIRNFNTTQFGAADLRLHARYNLLASEVMITSGTTIKIPTGYEQPTGTFFVDSDGNNQIGGQATLGDGQSDITQSILFGTMIQQTSTFLRAELGFRYRFGAPGHQGLAGLRAGQFIGDSFILMVNIDTTRTLIEGDIIGETFTAIDPEIPANDFSPDNVRVRDLRLDRDALNIGTGMLIRLGEVEVTANYDYTLWGMNTAAVHSFTIGTIFGISDISGR